MNISTLNAAMTFTAVNSANCCTSPKLFSQSIMFFNAKARRFFISFGVMDINFPVRNVVVAQQRHAAVDPGRHGVAVDHRVLEDLLRAAQHRRHVQPAVVPAVEVVRKVLQRDAPVPVALGPAAGVVDRDLGDPVDPG